MNNPMEPLLIRSAVQQDHDAIEVLHRAAFGVEEGDVVARLAIDLVDDPFRETSEPLPDALIQRPVHSLVAQRSGKLVAHVVFSPLLIDTQPHRNAYILAPLAVSPDVQRSGLGSQIVEKGFTELKKRGVDSVFVLGDPNYYRRFGFRAGHGIDAPYTLPYPEAWQMRWLDEVSASGSRVDETGKACCLPVLMAQELW